MSTSSKAAQGLSETGDPLLLTPGPLTTSKTVKSVMVHDWGSRDADFLRINKEVLEQLPEIINGQSNFVTVPVQGSGTYAVEGMLTTFVPPTGKVLLLSNGAYGQRARRILEIARRAFAPFDLERSEPIRLVLFRPEGPGETVLLLSVHHLVADFWSLGVMLRELGELYEQEQKRRGEPAALPPQLLSYGEWAVRERRRLAGPEGEELGRAWEEKLRGWPLVLELPADRPRPVLQALRGGAVTLRLAAPLSGAVRRLGRRRRLRRALGSVWRGDAPRRAQRAEILADADGGAGRNDGQPRG